ncbi:MAG: hypothetical protein JJ863_32410 [Deltaproteobacteria bacterium]|nr:hypothetical protein [Deltaproteobacteria bacterium]
MEVAAVAQELRGVRAPKAWVALVRHARVLAKRSTPPLGDVLALRPYLMHSFDPSADVLLLRALASAVETEAPEQAELQLLFATRAVQRGEMAVASSKARVAESLGAPSFELDMLDAHVAIRTGALSRARARVEEHARNDPRMRLQHAFFLLASGRHEDAGALLRRSTSSPIPLMRGAAEFFLTESSVRRGAWEEVLLHGKRSCDAVAFMGTTPHDVAVSVWSARALRHLQRPDLAEARARWGYETALRAGLGEAMAEALVELVKLGWDRERGLRELAALRSTLVRPEVRRSVDELLGDEPARTIVVDAGGHWIRVDGRRIDLSHRPVLRRLLRALVQASTPLDVEGAFRAGWPDEAIRLESRRARVYTAVWQLRRLGLPVVHEERGYVLDAEIL